MTPDHRPHMGDLERLLMAAQEQIPGPAQMAIPPIPTVDVPIIDVANPFMQQVTPIPTTLQTAVVKASDGEVSQDIAVLTIRNMFATSVVSLDRDSLRLWYDAIGATLDKMTGLIAARSL